MWGLRGEEKKRGRVSLSWREVLLEGNYVAATRRNSPGTWCTSEPGTIYIYINVQGMDKNVPTRKATVNSRKKGGREEGSHELPFWIKSRTKFQAFFFSFPDIHDRLLGNASKFSKFHKRSFNANLHIYLFIFCVLNFDFFNEKWGD